MAGKIYLILLTFGIIFNLTLLILFGFDKSIYGTFYFGVVAIAIAINLEINLFKLSNSIKISNSKTFKKYKFLPMITRFFLTNKRNLKILQIQEQEIIAKNKKLLRYFLFALILFGISTLLIFK